MARVGLREANRRRIWAFIIFFLVSVIIFYCFLAKDLLLTSISFGLFGLSLSSLSASLDNDPNYKRQSFIDFLIEYFYFFIIALLVVGIINVVLAKFISIENNEFTFYLISFTGSVYITSHIDFLRSNLLFFFKTR